MAARRKYVEENGRTRWRLKSVVVVIQRLIDLMDGHVTPDSNDDSWMRHQPLSKKEKEVLAKESFRMGQEQQTQHEQSQYVMDGDDLEENFDYPEDNEEYDVIFDPELEESDPRLGIPLPPDDPAPTTKPNRAVPSKAPERKTAAKGSKVLSGPGKSSSRVQKKTAAPRKGDAPHETTAPRKTTAPRVNARDNRDIFQDFHKGQPRPFILPIDDTPTNLPIQLPIRPKPQPKTESLPQPHQPTTVGNETRRVTLRMSRPKSSPLVTPPKFARAMTRKDNESKKRHEEDEEDEDEGLFVK